MIKRCTLLFSFCFILINVYSQLNNALDTTFGNNGLVIMSLVQQGQYGRDVTIQPDGKILVCGKSFNGSNDDVVVMRFNQDGSFDSTFGNNGIVNTAISTSNEGAYAIKLQQDGKILVAGMVRIGYYENFAVLRYNNNGTLDITFGNSGIVYFNFTNNSAIAYGIAIQSDNKIIVTGIANSTNVIGIARLHPNGSFDNSFGTNGKVTWVLSGGSCIGRSLVLQNDGKILIAGRYGNASLLVRFNTNGTLDTTFNSTGYFTHIFSGVDSPLYGMVLQNDQKILVSGYVQLPNTYYDFLLARFNADGTLDNTFGINGFVTKNVIANSTDIAQNMTIHTDGKIVLAGSSIYQTNVDEVVMRFFPDGTLDATLGNAGVIKTNISSNNYALATVVQQDGKILTSGTARIGSSNYLTLARYLACTPPLADNPTDIETCDAYILPPLNAGNYYTQPNGGGVLLAAGTTINSTQTLYVYATNGSCQTENSFNIQINNTPHLYIKDDTTVCDFYVLENLLQANYYSLSGGNGQQLFAGDTVFSNQTIYIYAQAGNCVSEESFNVTVINTPPIDKPADVESCDYYILPMLANGNYYSQTLGGGNLLNVGDSIMQSQHIYVYANNLGCVAEHVFDVNIAYTPQITSLPDTQVCDMYELPFLQVGAYYDESMGMGNSFNVGDFVISSQNIYIYAESGNCAIEDTFFVSVTQTPSVDSFSDVFTCDYFILPLLNSGNYYTQGNGNGSILLSGDTVFNNLTLYIYAINGMCPAETFFDVNLTPTPIVDIFSDTSVCGHFVLPILNHGTYYAQAGGNGMSLASGDTILSNQCIFIYEQNGVCVAEDTFCVEVRALPDVSVSENGPFLSAHLSAAQYSWLDCDNNFAPLVNATNQTFTAWVNGNYAVMITYDGCVDTSYCYNVSTVDFEKQDFDTRALIYPNPSNGTLNIVFDKYYEDIKINVYSALGQLIDTYTFGGLHTVDLNVDVPKGVFFVEIFLNNEFLKNVKIIKL